MADSINKDDEKFNELLVKQHSTSDDLADVLLGRKPKDSIEKDDAKMEDLLIHQEDWNKEQEFNSLEEKYEQQIGVDEIVKMLDRKYRGMNITFED